MKKKIAFILCSTGNEAFAVGNVILGAKEFLFQNLESDEYDIIFYTDKLMPQDELALKKIYKNIIIKIYESPFCKDIKKIDESRYLSIFAYARFEAFNLLDTYERVFYTDTDVVIQKDISDILDIEASISFSYFPNKSTPISANFNKDNIKLASGYNLTLPSIVSAVFLINDKLENYNKMTDWCYEKASEYKTNDQSVLCLLIEEFNLIVHDLTNSFGAFPDSEYADSAHIVHAIGPNKFWRGTYNKIWESNNSVWKSYGGSSTYEKNSRKRKIVDKIVWFIPIFKWRDKTRRILLNRMGLSSR